MTCPLRVIKVGGSLLDWPELSDRFQNWLDSQFPAANVAIVGGGALVDTLRELDHRHHFPVETIHWSAVRLMDVNAELFSVRLSHASLVKDWRQLARTSSLEPQVLLVEPFLREDAGRCGALPCGWEVTSDSIAARVAAVLGAQELVLLKSTSAGNGMTPAAWSDAGLVDRYFPIALATAQVRFVNLREAVALDSPTAARSVLS